MADLLYTIADAVEATGIGKTTVYDLVAAHSLGLRTVGGTPILREEDLAALIALKKPTAGRPRKTKPAPEQAAAAADRGSGRRRRGTAGKSARRTRPAKRRS